MYIGQKTRCFITSQVRSHLRFHLTKINSFQEMNIDKKLLWKDFDKLKWLFYQYVVAVELTAFRLNVERFHSKDSKVVGLLVRQHVVVKLKVITLECWYFYLFWKMKIKRWIQCTCFCLSQYSIKMEYTVLIKFG